MAAEAVFPAVAEQSMASVTVGGPGPVAVGQDLFSAAVSARFAPRRPELLRQAPVPVAGVVRLGIELAFFGFAWRWGPRRGNLGDRYVKESEMTGVHVVFGASGGIGNAVVRELARQGATVRGVNRSGDALVPPGVQVTKADASNVDDVRRVMQGGDVVYQCLFPAVQDAIIEVAAETGAKLVVASNHYMYDPTHGPMSEDSPHSYGDRRAGKFYSEMASQTIAAHESGKIRGYRRSGVGHLRAQRASRNRERPGLRTDHVRQAGQLPG